MSEQFSASTNLEKMMIQAAVQPYINALKQTHFHASMDNLSFIRINVEAINRTYIIAKCNNCMDKDRGSTRVATIILLAVGLAFSIAAAASTNIEMQSQATAQQ